MKIKISNPVSFFDIPISFSDDERRQRLLDIIASMLGIIAVIVLVWAVMTWLIWPVGIYEDYLALVMACIIMIAGTLIISVLNRFGSGYFARILFVALLLLLTLFDSSIEIAEGRALLLFSMSIIAAAILIQPLASFFLALISSIIVEIAAHSISPIPQPLPSIVVFFILAIFIWMATSSLEHHLKKLREANAALKESEERYRALVEISPDTIVLSDQEGKIIFTNQAGLELFGYSDVTEVVGKKIWEFIAPEDRSRAISRFSKMVENNEVAKTEYCALKNGGVPFFIEISSSVLKASTDQPQAVISLVRDVTLRKKMEQELLAEKDEAYRVLVNNSAQGLVLMQNGRIILANNAIANCIGLTPEELYALPAGKIFDFAHPDDREIGMANMQNRLMGKPVPARYETRLVNKNGTVHWLELMPTVIALEGIPTFQITTIDITERKQAEEAMRAARDQLEATLNTLPDILFELDREKRFSDLHAMKSESFFPNHEALLGKTVEEAMPPEIACIMSAALDDALLHGQHRGATYDLNMPGGKYSFELSISTMGDMSLPSGRFIMLVRDITERKRAEDALRISERKYRDLHESMMDGFVYVDMQGNILDWNDSYQQMVGYSSEELIHLTYIDLTPENWHSHEQKIVAEQILPRGYSDIYEKEYRKRDGTVFPVELRTFLIRNEAGKDVGMWAIVRDITKRKLAEEALRESEKRYRDLFENASLAVFQSAPDGRVIAVNPEFARMFGYQSPEDFKVTVKDAANIFADPQRRIEIIRLRAENPALNTFENAYIRKDGSTFLGQLTIKSITGENGILQCFEGFIEDITSRKQMEIALRESEERYRSLAEAAHDIIVIINRDDQIEYANQFAAQLLNMKPEDVVGLPRSNFFPPDINNRHQENLQNMFEHGQPMFTESRLPLPKGDLWLTN
jgi:PAS domain S-box-containing protein